MSISAESLADAEPKAALAILLRELQRRTEKAELSKLYPDDGPLAREKYVKHLQMFKAGAVHNERVTLGGNRTGKTLGIGGYETALHLTGEYPHWWKGWRFNRPILAWAAGTKAIKVRDTNQKILLGALTRAGTYTVAAGGLVPAARIVRLKRKTGVADGIDQVVIRHRLGWENICTFKSYEEGRTSFESEAVDWIWLDEEPTKPIYDECKLRLMTTKGRMLSTYTPVEGLTETTQALLEDTELL